MALERGLFILTSCWFSPTCLVTGDGNLSLVMETCYWWWKLIPEFFSWTWLCTGFVSGTAVTHNQSLWLLLLTWHMPAWHFPQQGLSQTGLKAERQTKRRIRANQFQSTRCTYWCLVETGEGWKKHCPCLMRMQSRFLDPCLLCQSDILHHWRSQANEIMGYHLKK